MREAWLRGIAANPAAPVAILLRLLHDDTRVAWETLCTTRDLPEPVIDAIVEHPNPKVGRFFGRNTEVDPAHLARLLHGPHPYAHEWLILDGPRFGEPHWRQYPDELIVALLDVDRPRRFMTRQELLWEIVFHQGGRVVPLAATHPDPQVREWASHSWHMLPDDLRQRLLHDPQEVVRRAAADAIASEEQVLEPVDLPKRQCHATWYILDNRRLSRAAIDQVIAGDDTDEIACLAGNASIPPDVVAKLMTHPSGKVRARLAGRRDLTGDQLERLAKDPDRAVRSAVSVNLQLDEALLAGCDVKVSNGNKMRWQPLAWLERLEDSLRKASSPNPSNTPARTGHA